MRKTNSEPSNLIIRLLFLLIPIIGWFILFWFDSMAEFPIPMIIAGIGLFLSNKSLFIEKRYSSSKKTKGFLVASCISLAFSVFLSFFFFEFDYHVLLTEIPNHNQVDLSSVFSRWRYLIPLVFYVCSFSFFFWDIKCSIKDFMDGPNEEYYGFDITPSNIN